MQKSIKSKTYYAFISVKDKEYLLTEWELQIMIDAMRREYLRYVYIFMRAAELGEYAPAIREAKTAFEKLCVIFACADFAVQVLKYHIEAEKSQRILDGSEDDEHFIEASEVFRGMTDAPLMIEIPETTGFTLWSIAGSWAGVLILSGLEPLTDDIRQKKTHRYAIYHASPELMPIEKRRRLTSRCIGTLRKMCARVQAEGKALEIADISSKYIDAFKYAEISFKDAMYEIGIPVINSPPNPDNAQKQKQKGPSGGWKAAHYWWLNTPHYKSLSSRSHEENKRISSERRKKRKEKRLQKSINKNKNK